MGHRCAYPRNFVGGHSDAVATTTDTHTSLGFTRSHGLADRSTEVGIVDSLSGVRSAVVYLMAAAAQMFR